MPQIPDDNSTEAWHRYFAIVANNKAWALVESDGPVGDLREMLSAAETAYYHWDAVGTDLHRMRAKMLLAEVHSQLGFGDSGMALITEVRGYFEDVDHPDWEAAFIATIEAHALRVLGLGERFDAALARARALIDAVADPEDKAVVQKTFVKIDQ